MHSPSYLPEHIRIQIKETIVYSLDLLKRFHSTLDHQFRFNSTSTVPPFLVRCMHNRSSPPKPIDVSIYIYIYNSVISLQILSVPRQSKASQIISVCKPLQTEIRPSSGAESGGGRNRSFDEFRGVHATIGGNVGGYKRSIARKDWTGTPIKKPGRIKAFLEAVSYIRWPRLLDSYGVCPL